MSGPIQEQNRAYRKGLVLGFTMAEIAIIIIFCLLLASAYALETFQKREQEIQSASSEYATVKEFMRQLRETSGQPDKIDQLFKELVLNKQQISYLQERNSQLEKVSKENEKYSKLLESLKTRSDSMELIEEIHKELDYGKKVVEIMKEKKLDGITPNDVAALLDSAKDHAETISAKNIAEIEAQRLKGQLANAQQKLEKLGRGTEMPACWADPSTGRPEYIFKIDLTSTGLIIHDQKLPNRVGEQSALPLTSISFDTEVNRDKFRTDTWPLFQWSVSHQCRFFVLVNDLTKAEEKSIYKTMLRTLEEHFYKFETR